jgi:hypothetical protein
MLMTYETIPVTVTAVQWNGSNLEEIRQLAPGAIAINGGSTLLVSEDRREPRALPLGGWVTWDGTAVTCVDEHTFPRRYRAAG